MQIEELANILAEGIDTQKINSYTDPKCLVAHFGERAVAFFFNQNGMLSRVMWNSFKSSCEFYDNITARWLEKTEHVEKYIFRIADNQKSLLIDNEYTHIV